MSDSTIQTPLPPAAAETDLPAERNAEPAPAEPRSQMANVMPFRDLSDRLVNDLIEAVKAMLRKETSDRLRDVYLIGDIEKDVARTVIERMRELANDSNRPITIYINSAGGNVTDGLAIHDVVRHIITRGIEVSVIATALVASDGQSNWVEGLQLMSVYLILALAFYFVPA